MVSGKEMNELMVLYVREVCPSEIDRNTIETSTQSELLLVFRFARMGNNVYRVNQN